MRLLICLVLFACPLSALAVYKCESVQAGRPGRAVTYSDTPCPDGKSSAIDTSFNTVGPEPASADSRLERQKEEVRHLERARHRREAQEDKEAQKAAQARAARHKQCAKLAQQQKWREEDAAMAAGKRADRARLKARRLAEAYQLECA
jgi:hypothetical protein